MPRIRGRDNHEGTIQMIWAIFDKQARFKGVCEDCGVSLSRKDAKIHHKKYIGATLNDLMIICQKCNVKPENIGLV